MIISRVTQDDLYTALYKANLAFSGNLEFNTFLDLDEDKFRVTLRVKDELGPGHRLTHPEVHGQSRRIKTACFHAHNAFIRGLPEDALIGDAGHWQSASVGKIQDTLVGGKYRLSELCECVHVLTYRRPRLQSALGKDIHHQNR